MEKKLQGAHGDSPLVATAAADLAKIKEFMSAVDFDMVLSSPQNRALATAEQLTDLPIVVDGRLREWDFGRLEGYKIADAIALYPTEMEESRMALDKFDGSAFGAESVDSVLARFDSLAAACEKYARVLWIGHGASGTAGIRHLAGFEKKDLRAAGGLRNNSVTILESQENGGFSLKEWGWLPNRPEEAQDSLI